MSSRIVFRRGQQHNSIKGEPVTLYCQAAAQKARATQFSVRRKIRRSSFLACLNCASGLRDDAAQ
jgi:hypothetical protein